MTDVDDGRVALDWAELGPWLAGATPDVPGAASGHVALLVDPAVGDAEVAHGVAEAIGSATPGPTRRHLVGDEATLDAAIALEPVLAGAAAVVAVGGGRVLDLVKLGTALHDDAALATAIEARDREGFLTVPVGHRRTTPLAAVPTTLGTGSERSQNAVVAVPEGRVLVGGPSLKPDVAVQDARATRGLPRRLALQGVFEAICRTVGPFTGGAPTAARQDQLAVAVTRRLVAVGHHLASMPRPGDPAGDDARGEVARLGGLGHAAELHLGRDPFGFKAWYVAHEVAWVSGIDKAHALAAVMPATWEAMADGRGGWGAADRLARLWAAVVSPSDPGPALSADPARGLLDLLDHWRLPRGLDRGLDLDEVVDRTVRRWGDGLPELGDVGAEEVRDVLSRAVGLAAGDHDQSASASASWTSLSAWGRTRVAPMVEM